MGPWFQFHIVTHNQLMKEATMQLAATRGFAKVFKSGATTAVVSVVLGGAEAKVQPPSVTVKW